VAGSQSYPTNWRKSRHSNPQESDCVEVTATSEYVLVRDSKGDERELLLFLRSEWNRFITRARAGAFDLR
jgi:Domain of unknown function (DUF397)